MSTAKATLIPATPAITETIVKVPEQPAKVVLEMTVEQAKVLRYVLGSIGGDPYHSPRGQTDGIRRALIEADVPVCKYRTQRGCDSIYFEV